MEGRLVRLLLRTEEQAETADHSPSPQDGHRTAADGSEPGAGSALQDLLGERVQGQRPPRADRLGDGVGGVQRMPGEGGGEPLEAGSGGDGLHPQPISRQADDRALGLERDQPRSDRGVDDLLYRRATAEDVVEVDDVAERLAGQLRVSDHIINIGRHAWTGLMDEGRRPAFAWASATPRWFLLEGFEILHGRGPRLSEQANKCTLIGQGKHGSAELSRREAA